MVVGFNHNFRYKGEVYHIQTEDGGAKSPQVVTLLYCGGTILASKKIAYADLGPSDNLPKLVEEMMKEQHREMLRRLKNGEMDDVIARQKSTPVPAPVKTPVPVAERPVEKQAKAALPAVALQGAVNDQSLDDIILSYLLGEET